MKMIDALAELQGYMILLLKKHYAQPLDKHSLTRDGGGIQTIF